MEKNLNIRTIRSKQSFKGKQSFHQSGKYDDSEGKEQGSLLFVESKYRNNGMGSAINMKVKRAQLNNRFDQSSSVRAHAMKG